MNINLDGMLNSHFTSVEELADNIGFRVEGEKVIPKGTVSLKNFKEALSEYIGEEIEAGANPGYVINRLAYDYEDQKIFTEILSDCERPFDEEGINDEKR